MRIGPHHHPCADCGVKVECCGDIEQNYDGFPEWICVEYHEFGNEDNWTCDGCGLTREARDKADREENV